MKINIAIAPSRIVEALVVPELPEVGASFDGHTVSAMEPSPLYFPQPIEDVYQYAVWLAHFTDSPDKTYLAVHEEQAETI